MNKYFVSLAFIAACTLARPVAATKGVLIISIT